MPKSRHRLGGRERKYRNRVRQERLAFYQRIGVLREEIAALAAENGTLKATRPRVPLLPLVGEEVPPEQSVQA